MSDSRQSTTSAKELVTALYIATREGVFRYLITLGLDQAKAQEISQDAFVRLYSSLLDGAGIDDPKCWVYRVAHNLALNSIRRSVREVPCLDTLAESLPANSSNPEKELLEEECASRLQVAIRKLSTQQRACLELRCEGLEYRQIGEVLGLAPSTVAEFVRRGIRQLRKWIQCQS